MLTPDNFQQAVRGVRDRALMGMLFYSLILALSMSEREVATFGVLVALGVSLHRYRLASRGLS